MARLDRLMDLHRAWGDKGCGSAVFIMLSPNPTKAGWRGLVVSSPGIRSGAGVLKDASSQAQGSPPKTNRLDSAVLVSLSLERGYRAY